jgi:hypothetical protein
MLATVTIVYAIILVTWAISHVWIPPDGTSYLDDAAVSGVSWNVLSEPKKVDLGTNGGI